MVKVCTLSKTNHVNVIPNGAAWSDKTLIKEYLPPSLPKEQRSMTRHFSNPRIIKLTN